MKKLLFGLLVFTIVSCEKDEITEVNEIVNVEEIVNNDYLIRVDTLSFMFTETNNYVVGIQNPEPIDSVRFVPKCMIHLQNAWVSMPTRVFTGSDISYLMNYSITADSTFLFAIDPEPIMSNIVNHEILFVWLPVQ